MSRYLMVFIVVLFAAQCFAADPLRVYVGDFNAVGAASKDETKAALKALMASRIGNEQLLSVGSAEEAELLVSGTYLTIGKQYNLDAVAKTAAGQTITRSYVHGEGGEDALFGAVNTLADKLSAELVSKLSSNAIPRTAFVPAVVASQQPLQPVQSVPAYPVQGDVVRSAIPQQSGDLQRVPPGDIIRPQAFYRGAPNRGEIKRLDGMFNLLAFGGIDKDGKRLLFMAQDRAVQLVREGESRPLAGLGLSIDRKILAIDYVDADGDGTPELYVTVVRDGDVSSQIWELKNNKLVKVADNIPYFFRAIALAGGPMKLYAQEQGRQEQRYYGDVYQVERKGSKIIRKEKIPMPRYGNIYSFNQIKHQSGELLTVVYHEDNLLVVYDSKLKELWRSNDYFGGSELFYQVEDDAMVNPTTDKYRWFFMNQRIIVTSQQEVLVGKNDGFWVLGNARMYKKGAVYSLYWNGAALEEVWRTKDTQNYMPDFWFDEPRNELLLLQLTQREDPIMRTKGASALQVKRVE